MQIEVYPTDADTCEAAAAAITVALRECSGRLRVVVSGARSSRATVMALAARSDVPWERIDWLLADERCAGASDGSSHAKALRDGLFVPRGIVANRQHLPPPAEIDAETIAERYAATVEAVLGPQGRCDVVIMGIDGDGRMGVLEDDPGSDTRAVVVVPSRVATEPPRISVAPRVVSAARRVIITVVGRETAGAVAGALRHGRGGARLALPSARVTWFADREAATELLADARLVDGAPE